MTNDISWNLFLLQNIHHTLLFWSHFCIVEQSACTVITAPEPHIVCKSFLGQRDRSVQVGDSQLCKQCKYHGLVHPVQIDDHPVQICIVWYAPTNRVLCSPLNLQQLLCALSACCSCTGGRCRNQRLISCPFIIL